MKLFAVKIRLTDSKSAVAYYVAPSMSVLIGQLEKELAENDILGISEVEDVPIMRVIAG